MGLTPQKKGVTGGCKDLISGGRCSKALQGEKSPADWVREKT